MNDPEKKTTLKNDLVNLINKSDLSRTAQNLLGDYLLLERFVNGFQLISIILIIFVTNVLIFILDILWKKVLRKL